MNVKSLIKKTAGGCDLTSGEASYIFREILQGNVSDILKTAFLVALKTKGEAVSEISAGANVLRENAIRPEIDGSGVLDTCGTGGDGLGTFNVSTCSAFICAAAGVKVAKHGNRSISSKCGSFDVLEAVGININLDKAQAEECFEKTGMCFLYAPVYHGAMKYVAGVRRELGIRTIFNILGPLANPVRAGMQVLGVYDEDLVMTLAKVLAELGVERAAVVHGCDGADEITTGGDSLVCEVREGVISKYYINPEMFGIKCSSVSGGQAGGPVQNAVIMKELLGGGLKGVERDMLVLNAGMAIYVAQKADDIESGVRLADEIIDSGAALSKLTEYAAASNVFTGGM